MPVDLLMPPSDGSLNDKWPALQGLLVSYRSKYDQKQAGAAALLQDWPKLNPQQRAIRFTGWINHDFELHREDSTNVNRLKKVMPMAEVLLRLASHPFVIDIPFLAQSSLPPLSSPTPMPSSNPPVQPALRITPSTPHSAPPPSSYRPPRGGNVQSVSSSKENGLNAQALKSLKGGSLLRPTGSQASVTSSHGSGGSSKKSYAAAASSDIEDAYSEKGDKRTARVQGVGATAEATSKVVKRGKAGEEDEDGDGDGDGDERSGTSNAIEFYLRAFGYVCWEELRDILLAYRVVYTSDAVWATLQLDLLAKLQSNLAKVRVYLLYAGFTTRDAEVRRKEDGQRMEYRRIIRWQDADGRIQAQLNDQRRTAKASYRISPVRREPTIVFKYRQSISCSHLELRDEPDWLMLERCLELSIFPSLNSARGGLLHSIAKHTDPKICPLQPSSILDLPDKAPNEIVSVSTSVSNLYKDDHRIWETVPDNLRSSACSAQAKINNTTEASNLSWLKDHPGVIPSILFAKDVTSEEHNATIAGLNFLGHLAGPGPNAHQRIRRLVTGGSTNTLPAHQFSAVINIWDWTTRHWVLWLAVLLKVRYFRAVKPIIIRSMSAKVSHLLTKGCFSEIIDVTPNSRESADFEQWLGGSVELRYEELMTFVNPDYLSKDWTYCIGEDFATVIGKPVIIPTGPRKSDCSLLISNYHDGLLKYDRIFLDVLVVLLMLVQRIAVLAEEALAPYIATNGEPPVDDSRFEYLVDFRGFVLQRIDTSGLGARLDVEVQRYQALTTEVRRRRKVDQGREVNRRKLSRIPSDIEASGELSEDEEVEAEEGSMLILSDVDPSQRLRHFDRMRLTEGEKNSPVRLAQFQQIDLESERLKVCGLNSISSIAALFPLGMNDEERRDWFLNLRSGVRIQLAAQTNATHRATLAASSSKDQSVKIGAWRVPGLGQPEQQRVFNSVQPLAKVLKDLSSWDYFCTTEAKKRPRILSCDLCHQRALTDFNGKHRCPRRPDSTKATMARDSGLVSSRPFFAHQLASDPSICDEEIFDDGWLSTNGLAWKDANEVLESARSLLPNGTLPATLAKLEPILVNVKATHVQIEVYAALGRLVETRSPFHGLGGPRPEADDQIFFHNNSTHTFVDGLRMGMPLMLASCKLSSEGQGCGIQSIQGRSRKATHSCPEAEKRGIVKNQTFVMDSEHPITRFSELPIYWQYRALLGILCPADTYYEGTCLRLEDEDTEWAQKRNTSKKDGGMLKEWLAWKKTRN